MTGRTCVFCASSELQPSWHGLARQLGAAIADAGDELVYGGTTTGLMGEVAAGARDGGGRVVGYVPESLATSWSVDDQLDELVLVPSMGDRKEQMLAGAHRVVVLPGGLGTLDELLEAMTFRQIGLAAADLDIVLLDPDGLYAPFLEQLERLVAAGAVAAPSAHLRLAATAAEAVDPAH